MNKKGNARMKVFTQTELLGKLSEKKLPLEELEYRFFSLNDLLEVKVHFRGWLPNLNRLGPFEGRLTVRSVISLMEQDISVEVVNDEDIKKLRNSIIYYNEYFVPDKEQNVDRMIPAPKAYGQIQEDYVRIMNRDGIIEGATLDLRYNPFKMFLSCPHNTRGENGEQDEEYMYLMHLQNEHRKKVLGLDKEKKEDENTDYDLPYYIQKNKEYKSSFFDLRYYIEPFFEFEYGNSESQTEEDMIYDEYANQLAQESYQDDLSQKRSDETRPEGGSYDKSFIYEEFERSLKNGNSFF
jgi:hypothetical protein